MKNIVIWLKNWTEKEKVKCISKIFETFESHKSSNPKEDNKNDSVDHVVHGHKPFQWNTFVAGYLPIFWKHPPLRNNVGASRFWMKKKGEKLRKDIEKKITYDNIVSGPGWSNTSFRSQKFHFWAYVSSSYFLARSGIETGISFHARVPAFLHHTIAYR